MTLREQLQWRLHGAADKLTCAALRFFRTWPGAIKMAFAIANCIDKLAARIGTRRAP